MHLPAPHAAGPLALAAHEHPAWEDLGTVGWIAVGVAGLVAAWVIYKAVRYTLSPGEEGADHIKRSILREPDPQETGLSLDERRGGGPPHDPRGEDGA